MERYSNFQLILFGLILSFGIIIAGYAVGNGISKIRTSDRYVSVKGLAEREVDADLVVWPISFDETGNDLNELQKRIDSKRETITKFLIGAGFSQTEISHITPKIKDNQATMNYEARTDARYRYTARAVVLLRSEKVTLVKNAMEKSSALIGQGIVLAAENWENRTEFIFTGLNKIKPEMIEEATHNARSAAEKFARDSGSKLGKIRNATQGLFSIQDRDINSPEVKKVRVVTTVEYFLIDE